jgi:hypothetical protein
MLAYYNERAPDYEEAYTLGSGTASITDPSRFLILDSAWTELRAKFNRKEELRRALRQRLLRRLLSLRDQLNGRWMRKWPAIGRLE